MLSSSSPPSSSFTSTQNHQQLLSKNHYYNSSQLSVIKNVSDADMSEGSPSKLSGIIKKAKSAVGYGKKGAGAGSPKRGDHCQYHFQFSFLVPLQAKSKIQPISPVPAAPGPITLLVSRATPLKVLMLEACCCFSYFHTFSTLTVPCRHCPELSRSEHIRLRVSILCQPGRRCYWVWHETIHSTYCC